MRDESEETDEEREPERTQNGREMTESGGEKG